MDRITWLSAGLLLGLVSGLLLARSGQHRRQVALRRGPRNDRQFERWRQFGAL
ncbi:MAG: hypothetical protein KBD01_15895 [Acidobacteria bacterium]|nr:hypothetical protein [Acidobacteriota bacterium]